MIPIAKLKKDIAFYRSFGALVGVLKLISATQYHSLEKKFKTYNIYLEAINNMFSWVDIQKVKHPYVSRADKPTGIIAITTDSGLLGGINSLVMNKAMGLLEEANSQLIIIGKRGKLYIGRSKMIFAHFPGIKFPERSEQALKLRDYVAESVSTGKLGKVLIVFPRALSVTIQQIEVIQLLPFIPDTKNKTSNLEFADIILESNPSETVNYLVYLWLGQKLFEIFGLSCLAEQSARFIHLQNCTQKIKELDKKLKFQYFRARHEIIDQNMRELYAARALDSGR